MAKGPLPEHGETLVDPRENAIGDDRHDEAEEEPSRQEKHEKPTNPLPQPCGVGSFPSEGHPRDRGDLKLYPEEEQSQGDEYASDDEVNAEERIGLRPRVGNEETCDDQ